MGWDFAAELARLGPGRCDKPVSPAAARRYCRDVAVRHYENFVVGSLLLPRPLVPHFHAVYAFCRWADDLADETGGGQPADDLLAWWADELARCYAGRPRHPVMVALRGTAERFALPAGPFFDLLSAFGQDQRVKSYATFADLRDYCRRSADPVGRVVLRLFRCYSDDRAALSDDICTGLQLANFWQDVGRDRAVGRVYIPEEDRRRFGYPDADLAAGRFTPAFADLMRFEVARTRRLFARGKALLADLPAAAKADVGLFLAGGEAVLDAVERQGFDVWSRRPVVSTWRKAGMLLRAAGVASGRPAGR